MLAVDMDYERLTGIPKRMERVFWWPTREWLAYTVEISLGKQDGVRHADPDAQLEPEKLGGGHGGYQHGDSWRIILANLEDDGPGTTTDIAERTGLPLNAVVMQFAKRRNATDCPARILGTRYVKTGDGKHGGVWRNVWGLAQHDDIPADPAPHTRSPVYVALQEAHGQWLTRRELADRARCSLNTVKVWLGRYPDQVETYTQEMIVPKSPLINTVTYCRLKQPGD